MVDLMSLDPSISLEDAFWKGMREIADERRLTLSGLVQLIDADRQQGNLSSAIRLFVLGLYQRRTTQRKQRAAA
jgi:predicted DNA-binding ribbon-helix-helix protein